MDFKDKYKLTRQENMFLAKKRWDENVYCGMKMENRAITFSQTQTILNGVNVPGVSLDDIQAVLNMRDAWNFLLKTVGEDTSFAYLCKLNEFVARNEALEWGKLRTGKVGISGTDYVPLIPTEDVVTSELEEILSSDATVTDKALTVFLWGARGQFFWDGNKRTSLMIANKILIEGGAGILTITDKYMETFNRLLVDYYNTGDGKELKQYMYDNAIFGID